MRMEPKRWSVCVCVWGGHTDMVIHTAYKPYTGDLSGTAPSCALYIICLFFTRYSSHSIPRGSTRGGPHDASRSSTKVPTNTSVPIWFHFNVVCIFCNINAGSVTLLTVGCKALFSTHSPEPVQLCLCERGGRSVPPPPPR